ncbi:MAG: AbrB/MazE/SpoVT family DNA-binding domain-containing protein [Armatimonadetes bacterium]|nr:AbrB/MazE/SpoVT family DNA-binding domain-containing protein [Armatimonadota bacterium]
MATDNTNIDDLFYGTVTVGERGQIVVPAQARADLDINPGDKLLVFGHPHQIGLTIVNVANVASIMTFMEQALKRARKHIDEADNTDE